MVRNDLREGSQPNQNIIDIFGETLLMVQISGEPPDIYETLIKDGNSYHILTG